MQKDSVPASRYFARSLSSSLSLSLSLSVFSFFSLTFSHSHFLIYHKLSTRYRLKLICYLIEVASLSDLPNFSFSYTISSSA